MCTGGAIDYVRPIPGATFCEMLNSHSKHEVSKSPNDGFVQPPSYNGHLGGSAGSWGASWDGRYYVPSFWGHNAGYLGDGCCSSVQNSHGESDWGLSYDIFVGVA